MARSDQVAGFILTGGASSRMGRDKAFLEIAGETLVERANRPLAPLVASVTVIGPPERLAGAGLNVVPDDQPGLGPLGGIVTALRVADRPWSLVVACDLPFLTHAWLEYLIQRAVASAADVLLPEGAGGAEPLCAMYHRRCLEPIRQAIARGTRKVTDALAGCAVEKIPPAEWKAFDSEGWLFKNMNTPADYEEALRRLVTPASSRPRSS